MPFVGRLLLRATTWRPHDVEVFCRRVYLSVAVVCTWQDTSGYLSWHQESDKNLERQVVSVYQKLLRLIETLIFVSIVMIATYLTCSLVLDRQNILLLAVPAGVGVLVFVWRIRKIPEFWEWGLSHDERIRKYSRELSKDRLEKLSPEDYEKYVNNQHFRNLNWENRAAQRNKKFFSKEFWRRLKSQADSFMNSKIVDLICFVLGPVLAVYGLVSFISVDTLFLYQTDSKILIVTGVALLAIGFVRRLWK